MNTNLNLKEVEKIAIKFDKNIDLIAKELKKIQSTKCRLKKCKGKSSYQKDMTEVLKYEQILKEARQLIEPAEKHVTKYCQEDVDKLDYDEVVKAIRSIQSKKTLSKWLTTTENDNDEYRNALRIEKMLVDKRLQIKPLDDLNVRKTEIQSIIETLEANIELSKESMIELLKKLV